MLALLRFDPERRITAAEAMQHPYFTVEKPPPKEERHMPTFRPTQEGSFLLLLVLWRAMVSLLTCIVCVCVVYTYAWPQERIHNVRRWRDQQSRR